MALENLAPDQRAVIQLVLQQGRSYAALAGLLGISDDAVRQRAHAGLAVVGGAGTLAPEDQSRVADYLLGQQDDDERATTEDLLRGSAAARSWAQSVAEALAPVARHGLPEIPSGPQAGVTAPAEVEPVRASPLPPVRRPEAEEDEPEPRRSRRDAEEEADEAPSPRRARRREAEEDEPEPRRSRRDAEDEVDETPRRSRRRDPDEDTDEAPARRSRRAAAEEGSRRARRAAVEPRQRPRRDDEDDDREAAAPPSSRLGGALVIGGLAILLVGFLIWMFVIRGDDDSGTETAATPTPTAQASPSAQPGVRLAMTGVGGSKAEGLVQINETAQGQVGFTLVARNVEPNSERDAYAVWLTGKGRKPMRLGFAARVGEDRTLATSGPEQKTDPQAFVRGLTRYGQMVVSRETSDQVTEPTTVVLRASLKPLREAAQQGGGG
ncbi:MAG TPA: sigma-70 region 4 domain-containing protein [Solirubrobacteraceae bacterium]|jgi:hypothetical protein